MTVTTPDWIFLPQTAAILTSLDFRYAADGNRGDHALIADSAEAGQKISRRQRRLSQLAHPVLANTSQSNSRAQRLIDFKGKEASPGGGNRRGNPCCRRGCPGGRGCGRPSGSPEERRSKSRRAAALIHLHPRSHSARRAHLPALPHGWRASDPRTIPTHFHAYRAGPRNSQESSPRLLFAPETHPRGHRHRLVFRCSWPAPC